MRWSNFFEGFDSLWDGEDDGAERDERRELIRADRATQPFRNVIAAQGSESLLSTSVVGIDGVVHVRRLGASWVDGFVCSSNDRVVIPLSRLGSVVTGVRCDCTPGRFSVLTYVTLGAVLRELERQQAMVSILCLGGGANGVVSAVWKDGLSVRSGSVMVTVQYTSLNGVIVRRS